ncbi:mitochondrial carrier domain-containing protein, partial [Dunaliella salina]
RRQRYRNTLDAFTTISRVEGPKGLFKGLLPTMLTNAPFSALYYMFYSGLKDKLSGQERPQAVVNFSSGVVAAMGATVFTQPADVVRTRMQVRKRKAG